MMKKDITYFAETNFRAKRVFGIRQEDRLQHMYILGKTGVGKTTMLETMLIQDIYHNRGMCLLDPHGDLATRVYQRIPKYRRKDVIYLDLTNPHQPWKYNPFKKVSKEKYALVTSGIIGVFEHQWKSAWGARLEHILRYTILALLEHPDPSFKLLIPMIRDEEFRKTALRHVTSEEVRSFWNKEFAKYKDSSIVPLLNKFGSWLAYPSVRRLLYENEQDISLRKVMDKSKILIVNLSKGILGEDASQLIGSLLMTSLGHAALSRADIPEKRRIPFHVFIDEFQDFTGSNMSSLLSEMRKYKVSCTLAHQYLDQLTPSIRESVLGNCGSLVFFRVGGKDAPYVARELFPKFDEEDILKIPNYSIYLKLLAKGELSKSFSASIFKISNGRLL